MQNAGRTSIRQPGRSATARRIGARLYGLAGAAACMASLGCFVYTYGVRLGAGDADSAPLARGLAVNVGLFAVFALHHSLLARSGARRRVARFLPAGLERATYVWTASILFLFTCAWWEPLAGEIYRAEGLLRTAGFVVQGAGVLLVVRSAAVLDLGDLAGLRQVASPTARPADDSPPELRIRGPYRRLRHPLYAGLLLALLGTPAMTYGRLSFALLSTAYIVTAIRWEERDMAARFGDRYDRYRADVRRRLVPGIY